MRLYRLNHLPEETQGHVFRDLVTGEYITSGEMLFIPRGLIAHEDEARHTHASEEVFVILQGKATVHFDEMDRAIGPGDVMVIDADENHHLESDADDPCVMLYLHFAEDRHPEQGEGVGTLRPRLPGIGSPVQGATHSPPNLVMIHS